VALFCASLSRTLHLKFRHSQRHVDRRKQLKPTTVELDSLDHSKAAKVLEFKKAF